MANLIAEGLKKNPYYLAVTPLPQLDDEGVRFEGETEKDVRMNQSDFIIGRGILTKYHQGLSEDERAFFLRILRLTVKDECFT